MQLDFGLLHPVLVRGVDDEDDGVGGAGVGAPKWPHFLLPAHVPQGERGAGKAELESDLDDDRGHGRTNDSLIEISELLKKYSA